MSDNKTNLVQQSRQSVLLRRRRLTLIISVAVVVILALFSAFVWPHWASKNESSPQATLTPEGTTSPNQPKAQDAVKAQPLLEHASDLLKAMPEMVGSYARRNVESSEDWQVSLPLEEYKIVYSTGTADKDVVLHVAQWSQEIDADKEFSTFLSSLAGKELASGKVKVSGKETGSYVVMADATDEKKAVVLWRNATVVFRADGSTTAVEDFYKHFPL